MKKIVIVLALIALSLGSFSCGGGGAGGPNVPPGENPGVPSVVQLAPSTFIAQTNSSITLHTKVLDGNGIPVANIPVIYTNLSLIGTLSATSVNTNSLGIATVTLFSSTPGFATILAQVNTGVGQVRDRKSVFFSTLDVLAVSMSLDVDSVPGNKKYNEYSDVHLFENDADDTVEVLATVFNAGGVSVGGGWGITWSSSHTEATFVRIETITNVFGQAKAVVQVTPSSIRNTETHVNIMAFADNGAANMVTLFLQPVVVDPSKSYLKATPSVVEINKTSTVTAVVMLNTGARAPNNTVVNFTTTCGTITPFALTTGGVATATFTAPPTPDTCTVTGKVGGVTIGTVDILVTTVLTIQPSTVTVDGAAPADPITFTVFGGIPPYTISISNPAITLSTTTVPNSGGTFIATVPAGTPSGSVTITARDKAGATATATITIATTPPPGLTVLPTTQTLINPTTSSSTTYQITGGTPTYSAFSGMPGLVSVTVNNSTGVLTAKVDSVPAVDTTVTITVLDSAGASKTVDLVLDVPTVADLKVTPTSATVTGINNPDGDTSDDVTFVITGGVSPYSVTSSAPGVIASPGYLGPGVNTFTVDPQAVSSVTNVTLTILDSAGSTVTATVTVNPVFLSISLDRINVIGLANPDSNTADDITFTVTGGIGPYVVTSSNPALTPDGTWTNSAAPFSVTFDPNNVGTTTTVTLTVVDNVGSTASATLTIFPVSTGLVISVNKPDVIGLTNPDGNTTDDITFTVTGGTPPYIISATSPPAYVENLDFTPNGPWAIALSGGIVTIDPQAASAFGNGLGATTVTLTVTDNVGAISSTTVTIHP